MDDKTYDRVREATRLTRAGRLAEATALLRGDALSPGTAPPKPDLSALKDIWPGGGLGDPLSGGMRAPATEPPLPEGAQFLAGTHTEPAGSRAYRLYVPSGYDGQAMPLVVMLHGCTQDPVDFARGTRMNARAEEAGCFVLYPAQPASANSSKCWNWFRPEDQKRGAGEPSILAGITRRVMRDFSVDPARVYVAGLSAGGAAAAVAAAAYPDLYAALGVHSGLACGTARDLPSAMVAMSKGPGPKGGVKAGPRRAVPTIVFHGDQDRTVHPGNGAEIVTRTREALPFGFTETAETGRVPGGHAFVRTRWADAHGRALLEQWVIHGAGHAWAGGSADGSYVDPRGPDASREMLRFFLEHRLSP
jgi:poly(hydroxyalkanoate) depolymerase family esterase